MVCFSTEGICCTTDLGHLAHPPPSSCHLVRMHWTWRADSASFRHIAAVHLCASYGMGSCFQRRFPGTTAWCFALGLENCLLNYFYGRPSVPDDEHVRQNWVAWQDVWLAVSRFLDVHFSPLAISGVARGGGEHSRRHLCRWPLSCIENCVK